MQEDHDKRVFLRHLAQTSPSPLGLHITHAEGLYLHDRDGKSYMDLISGIGVSILGHRHPAVTEAVKAQVDRFLHTMVYGEFVLDPQVRLAELLCRHLPESLNSIYYVNSGAEAVEGAIKLALRHTGRRQLASCRTAYHGSTMGALSLCSESWYTAAYRPLLPDVRHIPFNDLDGLEQITERTAAVILETIQAEAGLRLPDPEFLRALRNRCSETGALLVLDEIQAGMGRTGTLFAFEQYDIKPDVLLLGKGFGGGMPLAAFIASREIMQCLSENPVLGHITTFGGHPVCAASALATLSIVSAPGFLDAVHQRAALFRSALEGMPFLEIRQAGLWFALEMERAETVQQVIRDCIREGVLVDWFLFHDSAIRLAPPLVIGEAEIEKASGILRKAVGKAVS